ncbi:hypothetical protein R50345_08755 [Paenibacillus sp. FSL R5-0345]|uniref:HNH endonuclease family protein n=1 Tax=Paenibacillus sp. FSL R5-0345 TaxID=1536770 RepID=UPI0004F822E6|nr:HNH endonuclease family protein [Paenibacillus sp. FSL R5-0345]AIQ34693.1 hypothetical protein R50345_08755 [Paenibacillus sp. FSL R5-0345]
MLTSDEYIPSDADFVANLKMKNFRQDDQCKYILERIEKYHINFSKAKSIANRSFLHIKHIMPKTIKSKISKKEYGDWETYLGAVTALHDIHVNKIGNLTLFCSSLNIVASNNLFEEKKKNYEQSSIIMTKQLSDCPKWDIATIQERTNKLAGIVADIWRL